MELDTKRISDILFKCDPIGINFDVNRDEYDSEASRILEIIDSCKSIDGLEAKIYEIFIDMFDADIAGDKSKYRPIAEIIWGMID